MNLLARFDPGDAATRAVVVAFVQISIVILLAALLSRVALRRRADARHVLWLGVLVWVLISPAVAAVADHSGIALWVVKLPLSGPGATSAVIEVIPDAAVDEDLGPSHRGSQSDSGGVAGDQAHVSVSIATEPSNKSLARSRAEVVDTEASRAAPSKLGRRGNALVGGVILLWAAGALAGLVRIAAGWRRVAAFSRSTQPLDPEVYDPTLERVRDVLGITRLPVVVTSSKARGPVAIGLLRARVVLPVGLAESISSDALRDVLVHECAHVVRLDPWVGLLQRLAAVLFWPHLLVHYLNGQLTRAREEVCDNHVLQCGDRYGYARTLLALTEHCRPYGVARPGLGLLGDRWTLADRVAGLLDPRRIPMTGTTIRMKIALAVAIAVTGLAGSAIRLERPARADQAIGNRADTKANAPTIPKNGVWSIDGIVVDEQGKPVPGAVVHAEEEADRTGGKSTADGTFTLWMGHGRIYTRLLVAEADGGARIGVARFAPARQMRAQDPVRLVVKPARTVTVRVKDAAGAPIPGAAIEAFDLGYQFHATTAPTGVASLRVPADARIQAVIGLKSGIGFDYFENYRTTPANPQFFEFPPLPSEITLSLDGAVSVRIKVVGPDGQPMPGVVIVPFRPAIPGKISTIEITRGATTHATTDAQGIAVFDWLPKEVRGVTFFLDSPLGLSSSGPLRYVRGGPTELTAQLRRWAQLTGTVRFPDGRPARRILVIANLISGGFLPTGARTDDEGRYAFDRIVPGSSRMIAVEDEAWAAPSLTSDVLKEGQEQGGLDFTLSKGTLIHGRVTEVSEHRLLPGVSVGILEEGGPLPKELRTVSASTYRHSRSTHADAQGRYQIRVGPGRYRLPGSGLENDEPLTIEVKDQAEIIRDMTRKTPAAVVKTFIKGVVVEKTATGERPVAGALAFRWPVRGSHRTDEDGKFLVERESGETIIYAFCPDKALAGFTRLLRADADNVKVVLSPTATVTGRVIDSNGKPRANQRVGVRLASGSARRFEFYVSGVMTDDQGRFTYRDAPAGSTGEIVVAHQREALPLNGPRTVVSFEVRDLDPIQISDLVIPADKPEK